MSPRVRHVWFVVTYRPHKGRACYGLGVDHKRHAPGDQWLDEAAKFVARGALRIRTQVAGRDEFGDPCMVSGWAWDKPPS